MANPSLAITRQPSRTPPTDSKDLDESAVFTFEKQIQIAGVTETSSEVKSDLIGIEHDSIDKSPSVSPGYSPRLFGRNGYKGSDNSGSVISNQGSPASFKQSFKVCVGMVDNERRRDRHTQLPHQDRHIPLDEEELKSEMENVKEVVAEEEEEEEEERKPSSVIVEQPHLKDRLKYRFHQCTHRPVDPPYRYLCRGRCGYNANVCLHVSTCLCCVNCVFYHLFIDEEIDEDFTSVDAPFACSGPHCRGRWLCLTVSSLFLPCLCCYIPLRCCMEPCVSSDEEPAKKNVY